MDIRKIDDVRYRIEKGAQPGMNTGVTLYASETLLEKIKRDHTLQQSMNATTLPDIAGNVLLMPDAHEGYGVAIGTVFASNAETGLISPGAIGFDINCLHPEARVLDCNGICHRIGDLKEATADLLSYDKESGETISASPLLFLEKENYGKIIEVKSEYGARILVTGDHPLLTTSGMKQARHLTTEDSVVYNGFEGVEYVKPIEKTLLDKERLLEILHHFGVGESGRAIEQIMLLLDKLGLVEISSRHRKLPILIKLLGFVLGGGTAPNIKKGTRRTVFYGKEEDMLEIKHDVEALGFKCVIRHRKRHHKLKGQHRVCESDSDVYSATVSSTAFTAILVGLGAPVGNKVSITYGVPAWIMTSEDWQKRLFLASYFGAELSAPRTTNNHKFVEPYFRFGKLSTIREDGRRFLLNIKELLSAFGIETSDPHLSEDYGYQTKKGEGISFGVRISANSENLRNLFGKIGFIYNKEKERLARLANSYLCYLENIGSEGDLVKFRATGLHSDGMRTRAIVQMLSTERVGGSFIEHTVWGRDGSSKAQDALTFDEFVAESEVASSGLVYNRIISIKEIDYSGPVYDLTMDDKNHNFLANGLVVSNCGVRLIKTNLSDKEVRSKITQLSDALFKNVPGGVGSRLNIGLTPKDLERIAEEGVEFIIRKGFGLEEDIEHTEELGHMVGGDFSKISQMAKSRGLTELGTLGAGNHFLEVQKVEKLFDQKVAKAYGLYEGQIVVMVHTGSRGFGHQTCSDYLRAFEEYRVRKSINIVDKELCYAKIGDKEATDYLHAMRCAVNFAFANRQIITNSIRRSFEDTFGRSSDSMGMELLYDVSHNIAKLEEHEVDGKRMKLYVHRKGATRAFPKGRPEIPEKFRNIGQPVLIPGSMGTASYVLYGKEGSMKETFGSACHGAGRVMSRHQALRDIPASRTFDSLKSKNVEIRIRTRKLVSEEAEWTYKDVDEVVRVVEQAGIAGAVSRNIPVAVIKG